MCDLIKIHEFVLKYQNHKYHLNSVQIMSVTHDDTQLHSVTYYLTFIIKLQTSLYKFQKPHYLTNLSFLLSEVIAVHLVQTSVLYSYLYLHFQYGNDVLIIYQLMNPSLQLYCTLVNFDTQHFVLDQQYTNQVLFDMPKDHHLCWQ